MKNGKPSVLHFGMMATMDDVEWVTLFCYENVAGCPEPGRLIAV